jgi:arsenite methyltransferase
MAVRTPVMSEGVRPVAGAEMSLFERFPRLYAFFREHLFRDDTERIVTSLWPSEVPSRGETLIELGCGPGFYARRLAARFPLLNVLGIDRSMPQLALARERAAALHLPNCRFEWGDAHAIPLESASVDAVIASRLITILPEPERAIAEIHRVLRPGGRFFIAEPRPHPVARLPLDMLWLAAEVSHLLQRDQASYREPGVPCLLAQHEFRALIAGRPWEQALLWTAGRYQYALCAKA